MIAQTLSALDPAGVAYEAAGLAELVRRDLVTQRASFCMETVFSDPAGDKVQFLRDAQRTRRNVAAALQFVDLGLIIDNSSAQDPFRLVERWERGTCVESESRLIHSCGGD